VKGQLELRRDAGSPAQSTLRGHFQTLEAAGAMGKQRADSFPGKLEYELLPPGQELLLVASVLQTWLNNGPGGRLELGGDPAKAAIKGLVDGWASNILGVLAGGPHSLVELDEAIHDVNYPTLERRLGALRLAGQISEERSTYRGRGYAASEWVRHGVAPLVAAARWEHRNEPAGTGAITSGDVESAFDLIAPLLEASAAIPDAHRLSVKVQEDRRRRGFTGLIETKDGTIVYSGDDPQGLLDCWASGSSADWFKALIDGDAGDLDLGGDSDPGRVVLNLLHQTMFGEADE
jgi:DNA-binding HxlR family transcriptional regulator